MPQENNLDPDLSTCQNLLTSTPAISASPGTIAARAAARICSQFMHLSDRADSLVPDLSGGMKRRLMLARALMNDPELIILDEPTTGLDPQVRHLIWDRLLELKDRGITLLLTTHYMDEAQKLCDEVLIMDEARAVDVGTPGELIRSHVPPYVLELRADRGRAAEITARFSHLDHQASGQNLYFYGRSPDDFDELYGAYPEIEHLLRPASLEDVFLKLTGREIRT